MDATSPCRDVKSMLSVQPGPRPGSVGERHEASSTEAAAIRIALVGTRSGDSLVSFRRLASILAPSLEAPYGRRDRTVGNAEVSLKGASLSALVLFAMPCSIVSAQPRGAAGMIDGVVTDTNLVPLAAADISVLRSTVRLVTGDNGRFRITAVPEGQYLLTIRKLGYQSMVRMVEVSDSDTLRLSVLLERSLRELDTVVETARGRSRRNLTKSIDLFQGIGVDCIAPGCVGVALAGTDAPDSSAETHVKCTKFDVHDFEPDLLFNLAGEQLRLE